MLKILRDNLKWFSWILWVVIAVFIAFVFVDFGGGLTRGQGSTRSVAATVGDREVTRKEFEREYRTLEQRYRQAFGGQWTSEMADRMQLPVQALEQLVDRKLLAVEADRRGLVVSDDDVQRAILAMDGLKDSTGAFVGEEAYRRALRGMGYTAQEFESLVREDLSIQRLRSMLEVSVAVSDAEVERTWRDANESVAVRYVLAPTAQFQGEAALSAPEVDAYFQAHADEFRLPDQRVVDYLLVDAAALRAGLAIEKSDLEREYAQRHEEFKLPEQVRARHILVKIDDNRDAEAARKRIGEAKAKLDRGVSFEKVAAEYSDDPGSKDQGGDLGLFGHGAMVPPFEEAAFGAAPGQVVGPVETSFGLHLIETVEHQPERVRSFEEVEPEIRAKLAATRAKDLAAARAKDLSTRIATEKPQDEAAWKALADGTTVVFLTTPPFAEGDPLPGVGRSPDFTAAAFALSPETPNAASAPVEVARGWAILRLREAKPAHAATLAEVEPRVRAAAQREKANKLAEAKLAAAKAQLAAGRSLDEVAKSLALEVQDSGDITRGGQIPGLGSARALADAALAMTPGSVGGPVVLPQGAVLYQVVKKSGFDQSRYTAERESTRAELKRQEMARIEEAVLRERRTELGVRYDPDLMTRLNLGQQKS